METEIWKDIKDYEGLYQISNFGQVKSLKRVVQRRNNSNMSIKEKILIQSFDKDGYRVVSLSNNKTKTKRAHQLVAVSFLDFIPNGSYIVINHKDGNKSNNCLSNLEIITQRLNVIDAYSRVDTASGYTGVFWYKPTNRWVSRIWIQNKSYHLGYFKNKIDASNAYQLALSKIK